MKLIAALRVLSFVVLASANGACTADPPVPGAVNIAQELAQDPAPKAASKDLPTFHEMMAAKRAFRALSEGGNDVCSVTRGGTFEVLSVTPGYAGFRLLSTKPDGSACKQTFWVETSPERDPRRDIVRRMLDVVVAEKADHFRWDSPTLHRIVVISVKPEDLAAAEDFLMREFFKSKN
jgi:hypothetical protein